MSGLEKLGLPFGLVDHGAGTGAGAGLEAGASAGTIVLPMLASLPLRIEIVVSRPLLVDADGTFLIIVADLERLLWTKLPSKDDRSTIGSSSSSETAWAGDSGKLFRLEPGESPSGFSKASFGASEDECAYCFVMSVVGASFS